MSWTQICGSSSPYMYRTGVAFLLSFDRCGLRMAVYPSCPKTNIDLMRGTVLYHCVCSMALVVWWHLMWYWNTASCRVSCRWVAWIQLCASVARTLFNNVLLMRSASAFSWGMYCIVALFVIPLCRSWFWTCVSRYSLALPVTSRWGGVRFPLRHGRSL